MFDQVIKQAAIKSKEAFPEQPNDYMDKVTGLLMCGTCREPKERILEISGMHPITARCSCRCEREREAAEEAKRRREATEKRRRSAFGCDRSKRFDYTFDNDDGQNGNVSAQLKAYCDKFEQYQKKGVGLMLYSESNGSGKTFFACAVANCLIDAGYTVRVSDVLELRDDLFHNRALFFQELRKKDLVVIDDLGTENANEATTEAEYRIINDLTENLVPVVITTNYTPRELSESPDRSKRRIYDRILGTCIPIRINAPNGGSRRIANCKRLIDEFNGISRNEP